MVMINITGPRGPKIKEVINTTSISRDWGKGFSPFFLGPVVLYDGRIAQNMENAWQYSKVYTEHVDEDGNPATAYWDWASEGWSDYKAHRYPMGKGAKPLYSYWDGQKLTYIQARRKIYIPLYSAAVRNTIAFAKLCELALAQDIWLWDFDGWDYRSLGMDLDDVPDCETRKMGHAFVLAAMIEGKWGFPRLI